MAPSNRQSPRDTRNLRACLCLPLLLAGCSGAPAEEIASRSQGVVYGADDRVEWHALEDGLLKQTARHAVAALMPDSVLRQEVHGDSRVVAPSLARAYALCEGQRFVEQPSASICSAALVAADLVLTAGHCLPSASDCAELRVVFGYANGEDGALAPLPQANVFRCSQVVWREVSAGPPLRDIALLRLDRPTAPPLSPLTIAAPGALAANATYTLVGHPWGLPLKVDPHVTVLDARGAALDYALVAGDSFQGNSGAPLLSPDLRLAGTFLSGEVDAKPDPSGCALVRTLANDCSDCSVGGERVAYPSQVVRAAVAGLLPPAVPALEPDARPASCSVSASPVPLPPADQPHWPLCLWALLFVRPALRAARGKVRQG